MNSRERVSATIMGEPFDKRAFSAVLSLYGAELTGTDLEKHYNDPAAYAAGQSAVREAFKPDILCSPFFLAGEGEAFGGTVRYFQDQAPNLLKPAINSIDQLDDLEVPDINSSGRLNYFRQSLKQIVAEHGKEVPVCSTVLGPVDIPLMIMGIDAWLDTFLFDEVGFKRMMEKTIPYFIEWANTLFSDGADFLVAPSPFLNPNVVTLEIAKRCVPLLKEVYSKLHGPLIIHHTGGSFINFLEHYRDISNVAGFVVDDSDDLIESREKIGADKLLISGPGGPGLGKKSTEEIESHCRAILENRKDDKHFILMTTAADVALSTPQENISALSMAVEGFAIQNK